MTDVLRLRTLAFCAGVAAVSLAAAPTPAAAQTSGPNDPNCPGVGPCSDPGGPTHSKIGARLRLLRTIVERDGPEAADGSPVERAAA